jgi:hypothetical protein
MKRVVQLLARLAGPPQRQAMLRVAQARRALRTAEARCESIARARDTHESYRLRGAHAAQLSALAPTAMHAASLRAERHRLRTAALATEREHAFRIATTVHRIYVEAAERVSCRLAKQVAERRAVAEEEPLRARSRERRPRANRR